MQDCRKATLVTKTLIAGGELEKSPGTLIQTRRRRQAHACACAKAKVDAPILTWGTMPAREGENADDGYSYGLVPVRVQIAPQCGLFPTKIQFKLPASLSCRLRVIRSCPEAERPEGAGARSRIACLHLRWRPSDTVEALGPDRLQR